MVRVKNRYLLIHILFPSSIPSPSPSPISPPPPALTEKLIIQTIRQSLLLNFGELGWASSGGGLNVKYLSPTTELVILRCPRDELRTVWAAVSFVRRLGGVECCWRVLHVGGTIRKTQQSAILHNRRLIMRSYLKSLPPRQTPTNNDPLLQLQLQSENGDGNGDGDGSTDPYRDAGLRRELERSEREIAALEP